MANLFTPRTLQEIRNDNAAILRKHLGAEYDVNDPTSVVGVLNELVSVSQVGLERAIERMGQTIHPAFAEGVQLNELAAGVNVFRIQNTAATGFANIYIRATTAPPSFIGRKLTRTDGITYTVSSSSIQEIQTGLFALWLGIACETPGAIGNVTERGWLSSGLLTFDTPIAGQAATATRPIVGGSDRESDEEFRLRYYAAIRNASTGGNVADWERWALEDPAVVSAKAVDGGGGSGAVTVFVLLNDEIYPPNGIVSNTAIYDQVKTRLSPRRPAGISLNVAAPTAETVNVELGGVFPDNTTIRNSISTALTTGFKNARRIGGTLPLNAIYEMLRNVQGLQRFRIAFPTADVDLGASNVAILGAVTYVA